MQQQIARRLTAIVIGDIVGYSEMMGRNEQDTHRRVRDTEREVVAPTIAEHRGRIVKTMGDGFLAIFDSPVEAVRCALVIQQSMNARNQELPDRDWIRYRIGVNLGDVIIDDDDVYGEGVNIAARLEQLAEPGSVYIAGGIYEQVKSKLVAGFQSLGDRKVKNISEPISMYRVLADPTALINATRRQHLRVVVLSTAAVVALVALGAAGGWYVWRGQSAQEASVAKPPAALPEAGLALHEPVPVSPPASFRAPTSGPASPGGGAGEALPPAQHASGLPQIASGRPASAAPVVPQQHPSGFLASKKAEVLGFFHSLLPQR